MMKVRFVLPAVYDNQHLQSKSQKAVRCGAGSAVCGVATLLSFLILSWRQQCVH